MPSVNVPAAGLTVPPALVIVPIELVPFPPTQLLPCDSSAAPSFRKPTRFSDTELLPIAPVASVPPPSTWKPMVELFAIVEREMVTRAPPVGVAE